VLDQTPQYSPAWSLLGDLEKTEKHLEAAIDAYDRAIENSYFSPVDRLNRILTRIQLNDLERALKEIGEMRQLGMSAPGLDYAQGLIYYRNKRHEEAIPYFQSTLNVEGFLSAAFYTAAAHFALGNLEQSKQYATVVLSRNPLNIAGRKLLASIEIRNGRFKEVEELMRPVVQHNGEDIFALNLLAISLMNQGKIDESIQLLERLVALQPESPKAHLQLAAGKLLDERTAEGFEQLKAAIKLDPSSYQSNVLMIMHYLRNKAHDDALQAAKQFQSKNEEQALPYTMLGIVHLARQERSEAIAYFEKAVDIALLLRYAGSLQGHLAPEECMPFGLMRR